MRPALTPVFRSWPCAFHPAGSLPPGHRLTQWSLGHVDPTNAFINSKVRGSMYQCGQRNAGRPFLTLRIPRHQELTTWTQTHAMVRGTLWSYTYGVNIIKLEVLRINVAGIEAVFHSWHCAFHPTGSLPRGHRLGNGLWYTLILQVWFLYNKVRDSTYQCGQHWTSLPFLTLCVPPRRELIRILESPGTWSSYFKVII